jgi:Na+-translocating ferredoxin:NAD+ oxidoreductase RnfA subunit
VRQNTLQSEQASAVKNRGDVFLQSLMEIKQTTSFHIYRKILKNSNLQFIKINICILVVEDVCRFKKTLNSLNHYLW